ncbi:TRAP transporter permease [Bosea sp. RAC05]|uniref:TRAP transporter permease n=1 Tax=unclassified Bosea (in: a-proteobacteria) TaxID=2653178 RepID=UPI000858381F|nr:TRAP transporter, 4TM/12TM fusion family protein [Bosea sp. RAC05]
MSKDETKPLAVPDIGGIHAQTPAVPVDPEHGLPPGFGAGWQGRLLFWIAIAFSLFQIATAFNVPLDHRVAGVTLVDGLRLTMAAWLVAILVRAARSRPWLEMLLAFLPMLVVVELLARFGGSLPNQILRTLHVGFLCLVAGGLLAQHKSHGRLAVVSAWALAGIGFAIGIYHWVLYEELVARAGEVTPADLVVGIAAIAVLFVICWRFMGPALPIVSGLFLAYCLFGQWLPAPLNHRGYSLEQVIEHMSFGTEGIYATPTGVSATFIFLFILFGSFLERAGMIQLFTDIAMGLFGSARGGPAKVAVFSSGLMGTISGSGVANVVSTGQFTIPLMKRFGYRPAFAGGVEATASMGGQIMPPVMGAVAFIMAETIDVPYADIVQAAIVPAILYYTAAFLAVHLEAGKRGLVGLPREELPSAGKALATKWYLIAPLAVLVYLLFSGYTPLFSGSVGLALTVVLILGGSLALGIGSIALRVLFWVGLGLLCAFFFWYGILVMVGVVLLLVLASLTTRGGAETVAACREALADGARQAIPVGVACAVVGIVIGTMTLTGVGTIFGNAVVAVGEKSLFLALFLTMIVSLILGMGIPTIPNYIITSSIAAPILLKLGVPLIVSHMFVFYFGIMADLTPPVALAAFAAAPIAKESGFRISLQAVKIAMAGFVIPFMAVYDPALMLQPVQGVTGFSYALGAAYIIGKALLAITLWGAATIGFLKRDMAVWERALAAAAAASLVMALPITDEIGFGLAALLIGVHLWRARATDRAATA